MNLHNLCAAVGTGIIIGGYIPEIVQLVRTRSSRGVSVTSYLLWSAASALLLEHAWHIRSPAFIILTMFQAFSCLLIATLAYWFRPARGAQEKSGSPLG
jgi:hypothetical protein